MVNEDLPDRTIRDDEMVKREKVEGTPFTIVEQQGKTFIAIGMYKVSQDITYREAKEAIEKRDWGLMLNVSRLIALDEIKIWEEARKAEREAKKQQATNGQEKSKKYQ